MSTASGRPGIALRLLLILVLQAAALGWMVLERARLLQTGTEVTLEVRPVDPRDLLRGEYVALSYDISMLQPARFGGRSDFAAGDTLWVMLPVEAQPALPQAIFAERPGPAPGAVALRGRVTGSYDGPAPADDPASCPAPCRTLMVDYGVERYFVPEGEGRALEAARDDSRIAVVLAVASNGKATIKRLLVDGVARYEEPLL